MMDIRTTTRHISCMGGWCHLRDHCTWFHSPWRGQPSERLCIPGQDGVSDVVFVHIVRPAVKTLASQVGESP